MAQEPTSRNRQSTRRQFLKGRAALDAIEDVADQVWQAGEDGTTDRRATRPDPTTTYLMQYSREAMACEFTIYVNAGQYPQSAEAAIAALDLVDELEDQLTVYRDHSELMQINRAAAGRPVPVERRLLILLRHAVQLHRETGGAFDITAGPLSKVWGFYRRQGRMPTPEDVDAALQRVDSRQIVLDGQSQSVAFTRPNVEINLGGIGKGYALDRCAEVLVERGVDDFIIHGGRSSVLARGARLGTSPIGWRIDVRHPLRPEQLIAKLHLQDRAVGTSGSASQSFYVGGRKFGHILDPRTGWPSEGVMSVTAVAPCAATADALGTAFYVMGVDATAEFCQCHHEIGAMMICPAARIGDVQVHQFNLDEPTLEIVKKNPHDFRHGGS